MASSHAIETYLTCVGFPALDHLKSGNAALLIWRSNWTMADSQDIRCTFPSHLEGSVLLMASKVSWNIDPKTFFVSTSLNLVIQSAHGSCPQKRIISSCLLLGKLLRRKWWVLCRPILKFQDFNLNIPGHETSFFPLTVTPEWSGWSPFKMSETKKRPKRLRWTLVQPPEFSCWADMKINHKGIKYHGSWVFLLWPEWA